MSTNLENRVSALEQRTGSDDATLLAALSPADRQRHAAIMADTGGDVRRLLDADLDWLIDLHECYSDTAGGG